MLRLNDRRQLGVGIASKGKAILSVASDPNFLSRFYGQACSGDAAAKGEVGKNDIPHRTSWDGTCRCQSVLWLKLNDIWSAIFRTW